MQQVTTSTSRAHAAHAGPTVLASEQTTKWNRDGYLILPQFFGPDIVDPINALIERLSQRGARSNEIAGRVVVDLLAGSAHRRMRLARGPGGGVGRAVRAAREVQRPVSRMRGHPQRQSQSAVGSDPR